MTHLEYSRTCWCTVELCNSEDRLAKSIRALYKRQHRDLASILIDVKRDYQVKAREHDSLQLDW